MEKRFEKGFFESHIDEFMEYISEITLFCWGEIPEYAEINTKICNIKRDYPNVALYLEDEKILNYTETELNKILEVINLEKRLEQIVLKETFKLGMKEAVCIGIVDGVNKKIKEL